MNNIKAIIFDWGGVIVDAETKEFYPESRNVLEYCESKGYRMALAVVASKFQERKDQIEKSGLKDFFELIIVDPIDPEKIWDPTYAGKDKIFDKINDHFKLPREQVVIIDDRTVRGIKYANQHGHPSIWIKHGKFGHELPNETTGQPTYTVSSTEDVMEIL